jgi:hypothetical protein
MCSGEDDMPFYRLRSCQVLAVLALYGCGERFQAGLANAPSAERKSEPRREYDVITTGDEACKGRAGGAGVASAAGACGTEATPTAADAGPTPALP